MSSTEVSQAIEAASRALAAIVSLAGIVVIIGQWTRPAILKRRAIWLRETISHEENESRLATLQSMLRSVDSSLVAGVLVPGWRFLLIAALMLLGPIQAFAWASRDADVWNIGGALILSLALTANTIRLGVRLLAERYRVAHEYREGDGLIQSARLGLLNLMEGGTRFEFGLAALAAFGINAVAVGIALGHLQQKEWGLGVAAIGALSLFVFVRLVTRYAKRRVGVYGPWSVEDASL